LRRPEGLVHSVWHRGTTVVDVTVKDVEEVYTVRVALDRLAATSAQKPASAEQLAEPATVLAHLAP
jgi:DNA-binding GntR family transcriptional regulator